MAHHAVHTGNIQDPLQAPKRIIDVRNVLLNAVLACSFYKIEINSKINIQVQHFRLTSIDRISSVHFIN